MCRKFSGSLIGGLIAALMSASSGAAQSLSDEARHFLVYQPAQIHSFTEHTYEKSSLFYLHYSHVARKDAKTGDPIYNLVVQVSRDPSPAMAAKHCEDIFKTASPPGTVRTRLPGYACAFVQRTTTANSPAQYRSTWIAKCYYMVSLGETAVDMPMPGQSPIAPLLAGLDAAIAQAPPDECPPPAPAVAEAPDMSDRCPLPRSAEALGKVAALDFEHTLAFLRRQLSLKSDAERLCFNYAIRRYPDAVESVTPAYYDALQLRATYSAAVTARNNWFGQQTAIEERTNRSDEQLWDQINISGTGVIAGVFPAAWLATALSAYRLALINTRDLIVLPPFHEGLYARYKGLRGQHDSIESFDLALQGSAYHLLVQQMTPVAGAQNLSGEERTSVIARFWRTRLEARYQIEQALSKGPPDAQVNAALAPARRCIGGLRQDVAQCVQEAERAVSR